MGITSSTMGRCRLSSVAVVVVAHYYYTDCDTIYTELSFSWWWNEQLRRARHSQSI